jgi:hypothetical protein
MKEMAKMFVSQGRVAELEKRVATCEGRNDSADKTFGNHEKRLSDLELQYRSLVSSMQSLN